MYKRQVLGVFGWWRRESNPRPKAFGHSVYMLIRGKWFRLFPNLPSRARKTLAWIKFRPRSPQAGGATDYPTSWRLVLTPWAGDRETLAGIKRPELLHNRWRLCFVPLFYEASGVLGMQP